MADLIASPDQLEMFPTLVSPAPAHAVFEIGQTFHNANKTIRIVDINLHYHRAVQVEVEDTYAAQFWPADTLANYLAEHGYQKLECGW